MAQLHCIVVTPERTIRDQQAEFVALPLFDGEIGIAPRHSPMIGRLGFGELRITTEDRIERLYVEGGFVEVLNDVVSVLTNRAVPAQDVDREGAEKRLAEARQRKANSPDLIAVRDRLIEQSRAQLRVSCRAAR